MQFNLKIEFLSITNAAVRVVMISNGDRALAKMIRKENIHKLGNLTLKGYNSQLSNIYLEMKQNRKDKSGKYIGFKNGLTINEQIKDIMEWKPDHIKNRTEALVKQTLSIFSL